MTAAPPPKVIPKGTLGVSVWVLVLLTKFHDFVPSYRLLGMLRQHGLDLALGTITDGLRKMVPLFEPLYDALVTYNRQETHWQADETRWLVFVPHPGGKANFAWNLWVFRGRRSVVFVLDPTRTHHVPEDHLPHATDGQERFLSVDRYSSYKAIVQVKNGTIVLAFCWAHMRRDFIYALVAWRENQAVTDWCVAWLQRIAALYDANDERLAVREQPDQFAAKDRVLRAQIEQITSQRRQELQRPDLHPACVKILNSMENHWSGLTVFVEHPEIPMDNNAAERAERGPVVGRNNFYGSGALWSGCLAAMLFSILQTLELWGLNVHLWLTSYLQACAEAGGKVPSDLSALLPWSMSDEQRQAYQKPARNGTVPDSS